MHCTVGSKLSNDIVIFLATAPASAVIAAIATVTVAAAA